MGNFENRGSYKASTRGHIENIGVYSNLGYKLNENQILSFHLRADNHKTTNFNETYKLNFSEIWKCKFNSLTLNWIKKPYTYELYGTDNYGIKGNTSLNPEKSKTNELKFQHQS